MYVFLGTQSRTSARHRWLGQLFVLIALVGLTLPAKALTEYGGTSDDWSVRDNNPVGASFSLLEDPLTDSPVLTTEGDGTRNGYQVGNTTAATGWNNTEEFIFNWSLKTTEAYNLYVRIETANGLRWIRYNHSANSSLLNARGTVIHHGLGWGSRDGQWHSWSRDLRLDLLAAEPDNTLLAVHGLVIRGDVAITRLSLSSANAPPTSVVAVAKTQHPLGQAVTLDGSASHDSDGAVVATTWRNAAGDTVSELAVFEQTFASEGLHHYLLEVTDDAGLSAIESVSIEAVDINVPTVYSNAESDSLDGWSVRDNNPSGATVSRVEDGSGGNAIALTGAGWTNSYRIGHSNTAFGWDNQLQHVASWRSKADAYFAVFVRVETSGSTRWLRYDSRTTSTLLNARGTVIHHALGATAIDGSWHTFTRDLQADLNAAQPDEVIHAVHGVIVRGNLEIDDLQLMASIAPPIAPPSAPQLLTPAAGTAVESGTDVLFSWSEQSLAQHYDFKLTNSVTGEELVATNLGAQSTCAAQNCTHTLTVDLPAGAVYSWSVSAGNESGASEWVDRSISITPAITEAPDTPSDFQPAADAVQLSGATVAFSWAHQATATHYDFSLINAFDGLETTVEVIAATSCTDGRCEITQQLDLPTDHIHTWRVRARNRVGESLWAMQPLDVVAPAPDMPTLVSPGSNAVLTAETDISFNWNHADSASDYRLSVSAIGADVPLFNIALPASTACSGTVCSHSIALNFPSDALYQWSLVAANRGGDSAPSTREFELIPPAPPAPSAPTLTTPEDNATHLRGAPVTFGWLPSDEATHYVFAVLQADTGETLLSNTLNAQDVCDTAGCTTSTALDIPTTASYQWTVTAFNGDVASELSARNFSLVSPPPVPTSPTLFSPESGTVLEAGSDVAFSWSPTEHATGYEFELKDGVTATAVLSTSLDANTVCDTTSCSYTATVMDGAGEGHSWQVRALSASGMSGWTARSFATAPPPPPVPAAPVLLSPDDGAQLEAAAEVAFSWSPAEHATGYEFELTDGVSATTVLSTSLDANTVCDTTSCSYTATVMDGAGEGHSWQVRALSASGMSGWTARSFATAPPPPPVPAAPVLLSPVDGAQFETEADVTFSWEPVEHATSYALQLVDGLSAVPVLIETLDATAVCDAFSCTHTATVMETEGESHSWHIQAINSAGGSGWASRSFSTQRPIPPEPEADFSVSAYAGVVPFTLDVDASASSDDVGIVLYHWSFGEDAQTVGEDVVTASHVFTVPGSYDIVLTLTDADGNTGTHTITVTANDVLATQAEAARLLTQATFGPTLDDITAVQQLGIEGWIDEQLTLMGTPHEDYVRQYSNGGHRAARHQIWWMDAVDGEDQLRQRVAFALSQLFVVSDVGYTLAVAQYGVTHFYDLLRENALGTYRELLEDVTLSPIMGLYLSMLQNAKGDESNNTRADENFAREVMQLFSIGLDNLNLDGSLADGPAFTQAHVEAFSRVFTGWNYKDAGHWDRALHTNQDMISPMEPWEDYHDTGSKTLLNGVTLPAGQSARVDLEMALDNIAAHQNVGPFISTHLIRHLVTSNPSPAYVARVATVFNNNGYGVRGDLGATVKAILMDPEARTVVNDSNYGKVREPVLRLTHLWRAFSVSPGNHSDHGEYNTYSPQLEDLNDVTGQAPLRSPSVFNFFSPDYAPSGPVQDNWLVAPELEIFTDNNILKTASRINSQIYRHYKQNPASVEKNPSYLDYEIEIALAANPKDLIDHLNLLLLSREVDPGEYRLTDEDRLAFPENLNSILYEHLDAMDSDADGLVDRVQDALAIITSTPDYLVQK